MTTVAVTHRTSYEFAQPVALNPHRMMLRPRSSPLLKLHAMQLDVPSAARIAWADDVYGNAIATARFDGLHRALHISSRAEVEILAPEWPVFEIAASAIAFPFTYSREEQDDLGVLMAAPSDGGRLAAWARGFVAGTPTDTLSLLKDINATLYSAFRYETREREGTQAPTDTIALGSGTCRDFAELFTQAVRALGFGSRVVSGYLRDSTAAGAVTRGSASTHAWSDVFVPGAGWIAFDPTNGHVGAANLIPVAVASRMQHLVPVAGSYDGPADAYRGMTVTVDVGAL